MKKILLIILSSSIYIFTTKRVQSAEVQIRVQRRRMVRKVCFIIRDSSSIPFSFLLIIN